MIWRVCFQKGTRIGARSLRNVYVEADTIDHAEAKAKADCIVRGLDMTGYRLSPEFHTVEEA